MAQSYEYRVVPAPKRGKRGRGIKGPEARFAHALEDVMNAMAAEGWDYVRTDTLPAEERTGLTSKVTVFQNVLVFRRSLSAKQEVAPAAEPLRLSPAAKPTPLPAPDRASEDPAQDTTPTFAMGVVEDALWDDDTSTFTVDILKERANRLKKSNMAAE